MSHSTSMSWHFLTITLALDCAPWHFVLTAIARMRGWNVPASKYNRWFIRARSTGSDEYSVLPGALVSTKYWAIAISNRKKNYLMKRKHFFTAATAVYITSRFPQIKSIIIDGRNAMLGIYFYKFRRQLLFCK